MENTTKTSLSVEEQYKNMTEIEHILARPGVWVGNVHTQLKAYNLYVPSKNKILSFPQVAVNEGLLKVYDELITNSIDERIKADGLFIPQNVDVEIWPDGRFIIKDDGGIKVVKHKVINDYLPVMLFGMLRSSGNYGEVRKGSGLNGLGSKLTNIYSSEFQVITCDTKNMFTGNWKNNMQEFEGSKISYLPKDSNVHYTQISGKIELHRFGLTKIDDNMMRVIQKRCIEGAAISPGITVNFTAHETLDGLLNSSWKFESFKEFVELHIVDETVKNNMIHNIDSNSEIVIMPSIGYNFGFVNGAACSLGTHIRKVELQYYKRVQDILKSDNIDLITEKDILNKTTIFVSTKIINPDFDSQAKDNLSNKIGTNTLNLTNKMFDGFKDNEIYKQLLDYYESKYLAEKKKQIRKMNTELKKTKSDKLMKLNNRNPKTIMMNELFIFEGTSASAGFDYARNPEYQACYLLRGKLKNTFVLTDEELFKNQETRELTAACKLQLHSPKQNLKDCLFGKIIFATDADYDGYHITGLLTVFYAMWFPELFVDKRIYRLLAPIGVATKGTGKSKDERYYYTYEDFEKAQKELKGKGYTFTHKKGLGSLNNEQYKELIANKKIERIILKENYKETLRIWFDKSVADRKAILLQDELFDYEIEETV